MKTTLLVLFLLATTAAFGQYYYGASSIPSEPHVYEGPTHPQHAGYVPMAAEQTVYATETVTFAQGDRPASDFPQAARMPLGDAARLLRKEHERVKKARVIWIN